MVKICARIGGLGLLSVFMLAEAAAQSWRWSNPLPHGNNILDLALHDGVVWQAGERGQLYTSADLDHWLAHETGTSKSLRSIAFFGGEVFISAAEGTILRGANPDSLTIQELGTADWLEGIAASETALVAVGDNGAIYSSPNGSDWTRRGEFSTWLRAVAYGAGGFIAVGEEGLILTSTDGTSWTQAPSPVSTPLNRVKYVNDRFWIAGNGGIVLTNSAAAQFHLAGIPGVTNNLYAVAGNSEEIIAAGELGVWRFDLASGSWSPEADAEDEALAPVWPYFSALWDGRLFLLGGRTGMKVEGYRPVPTGPLVWFTEPQPTRSWLWDVTRVPELYVAAGDEGAIVTSSDGAEWFQEAVPLAAQDDILLGIGANSELLVAAGTGGTILYSPNVSTNSISTNATGEMVTNTVSLWGVFWHPASSGTTHDLQGVAANDDRLIVTGAEGTILTSTDGVNWIPLLSPVSAFLSGAASWPEGFIAVGDQGTIVTSGAGVLWQTRDSGVTNWIYRVRHLGDQLIAVGEAGLILTSSDGRDWQRRESGTDRWLNDVSYADGEYYVTGDGGVVLASPDGVSWSEMAVPTSRSLYGIASAGSQLAAVGREGVILRLQAAPSLEPVNFVSFGQSEGSAVFLFEGGTDQEFTLETTPALGTGWESVGTLQLGPDGTLVYSTANTRGEAAFYRTAVPPR